MEKERYGAVRPVPAVEHPLLYDIWELSVAATHHFLAPADFEALKPQVRRAFEEVENLYAYYDGGVPCGFVGVEGRKVEMLFVDPDRMGQGIGSLLLDFALYELGADLVDVNEQNTAALSFYTRKGFAPLSRYAADPYGKPYPILALGRV